MMRGRRSLLPALILTVAGLAAAPAEAQEARWPLVRFSYSSGWDAVPAVVAIERGFFVQEQVVVSALTRSSEAAVINSLHAGSTDLAAVSQRTLLVMAAAQVPVKIVAMGGWGTEMELVAPKESPIKRVEDLKGRSVAVVVGSEALPVLVRLLNRAKLRPDDVKVVHLSPDNLLQAFRKEKPLAEAVLETRHYTSTLLARGDARVVLSSKEIVSAIGFVGASPLVARTAVIDKEPATVQKFVNAWVKALAYIRQDPEDVVRLMTIFFHRQGVIGINREMLKSWVSLTNYTRTAWAREDILDAEYNGWALHAAQILKVTPKIQPLVENRFAEEATKRLAAGARP